MSTETDFIKGFAELLVAETTKVKFHAPEPGTPANVPFQVFMIVLLALACSTCCCFCCKETCLAEFYEDLEDEENYYRA